MNATQYVPPVVVVGNVKGGVAKTTTAVQLALHLGGPGYRVLLVDADPGSTALSWATRATDWPHDQVVVISHHTPDLPRRLPGLAHGVDLVIVDTPHDPTGGGRVGPMLTSALAVADLLIVPTPPNGADLDRLGDLLAAIEAENTRRDLPWTVLVTRADLRRAEQLKDVRTALAARGLRVLSGQVPQRAAVADAFGTGERRVEYAMVAAQVFNQLALLGVL